MAGGLRVRNQFPVARGILAVCVPDFRRRRVRAKRRSFEGRNSKPLRGTGPRNAAGHKKQGRLPEQTP